MLIKQAIAGNRNLVTAKDNLAASHEAVLVAAGGLYPQVDFGASVERQRNNFEAVGIELASRRKSSTSIPVWPNGQLHLRSRRARPA